MSMDGLMGFFQGDLVGDFSFTDDQVIDSAVVCESELKRSRLDLPPPPPDASEYPTRPFGLFVPASVEEQIGRPILETPSELLRGRKPTLRRDSRLSISIPPDGGPVAVESLDIPTGPTTSLGPRLPSVVSMEEDENVPGGSEDSSEVSRQDTTARERRAAYAKSKQVPNGVAKAAPSSPISLSSQGKSVVQAGQSITLARQTTSSRKGRGRELVDASENAAPQTYGVSVRL